MTDFSFVVTVPVDEFDEKGFVTVISDLILNKTSSEITRCSKHGHSKILLDTVSQHIDRIPCAFILVQSPRHWTHGKLLVRNG